MGDPRYQQLARTLITYSCAVQAGERVLIEGYDTPIGFLRALVRQVEEAGGHPLVSLKSEAVWRDLILSASDDQMGLIGETEGFRMDRVQAYVGVRNRPNIAEWSDIPAERMALYRSLYWQPVHLEKRVPNTRWVVLRWPGPAMAQMAGMSTEAFEDFYFEVCGIDYARMSRALLPLQELMEGTDRVRLAAPGTDLEFSIRDIPAIPCDGHYNIPDGEVFTAPVKDSIEGTIRFNSPTVYDGVAHDDIELRFEKGRIVEAESSNMAHLREILDADEGARYIGEFAIGFHPKIERPMRDILFDEKIAGSIHLTPGNAYDEADNGNRSAIHWDLVLRMTPDAGGGEIYFDDRLVRKDGRFVLPELEGLNPEHLL